LESAVFSDRGATYINSEFVTNTRTACGYPVPNPVDKGKSPKTASEAGNRDPNGVISRLIVDATISRGESQLSPTERAKFPTDPAEAIEQLMNEYGTKILHLAYYHLKDRQIAEDVAQEVFMKAFKNWDSFRGESSAYTWLYKIAMNLCRDKVRSAWWRRLVPSEEPRLEEGPNSPNDSPGRADGPEEAALKTEQSELMMKQVESLPEAYREVVLLYYYHDLSTVEISEVTGQNENTIKTRLFRARNLLKDLLMKGGVVR